MKSDELEQLWDDGFENDSLDPGDIFNKTINYCRELERKLKELDISQFNQPKVSVESVTDECQVFNLKLPSEYEKFMNVFMAYYDESSLSLPTNQFIKRAYEIFEGLSSPAKEVNDWKQIESDFHKWAKSKWCPTHEQIFEWMRDKLQSLPKDNTIHDKIKPHISDEEAVISKWIRKDNLRSELIKYTDFIWEYIGEHLLDSNGLESGKAVDEYLSSK